MKFPLAQRSSVQALIACGLLILILRCPLSAQAQRKEITLNETYSSLFYGDVPDISQWLRDSVHYLTFGSNGRGDLGVMKVNARTGEGELLLDRSSFITALTTVGIDRSIASDIASRSSFTLNRDEQRVLLAYNNDLYVYDLTTRRALRLTNSPDKAERDPTFSPDGNRVAFTRDYDLYVVDVGTPAREHRLTKDGSSKNRNGVLDWVYEEEVYGRGRTRGFEWSPDSRRLAFLRIDDSPVRPFPIIDHLPTEQTIERWEYPLAGAANPVVTLNVAVADGQAPIVTIDSSKYPPDNRLLVRFAWLPNGRRISYQVQPRNGNFLDLNTGDAETGRSVTLFRETTPAWVEILDNPLYLQDGSFLWLSDRTGYRHLYHYRADGTLIGPVTRGEWDIRRVHGLDPKEQLVYFDAAEFSTIADNAYRVRIGDANSLTRLTQEDGDHKVTFSPDCSLFIDGHSSVTVPKETLIRDGVNGNEVRVLSRNGEVKQALTRYRYSRPELLQVKTADGFLMEAQIIRPPDFDPTRKYPVWMEVYGGPSSQTVRNEWDWTMWRQAIAQKGYIVWSCDNRSASGKGMRSAWTVYRKLGVGELADIEESLGYLKSLPYVDASRIGISGWSYGGFLTEFALTHSDSFKCGFSGAGVADWHLYDSIYTERLMDTPQANAAGYRLTSVIEAAPRCHGRLMLVHGMMDDNVHLQNTIQLVYALQKAGKDFDLMLYPSLASRHDIEDPAQSAHLRKMQYEFIQKNL